MLTADDIATYHRDGLLFVPGMFTGPEVEALRSAFERDAKVPGDHRITEDNDTDVRAIYASHLRQPEFTSLTRSARLLGSAQQLLNRSLYLYQLKTNAKPAFAGDRWAWHQDFLAWRLADNIAHPHLVNVGVFLDDVTEFNGPVIFVPRSHTAGLIRSDRNDTARSAQHLDPNDIALTPAELAACVEGGGMVSPKGPAGSVVFFHPEIVHGSAANMAPYPRRLAIITYNDVANPPRPLGMPRPEYLASPSVAPLTVEDEALTGDRP